MRAPNPIALQIGSLTVRWYGVLIASALVIGLLIAAKRADHAGIARDDIYDFFIVMVPSIIVGARLWYVIFQWDYYSRFPGDIIKIWNGGLAIHGGIIAGLIAGALFCKARKLSFLKLADVLIPALPLGQAIGRWGNFFNQEAYGRQTDLPWAITVHDPRLGWIHVHPTFLYESVWDLCVFLILLFVVERKIKKSDGELLFSYFILYSIGRFFIEGLRTDSLMFFGLRTAQLVSLALIAAGIVGLLWLKKRRTVD
ncbi:prolipoprotein diacylglyceryl transferase [Pseudoramibacter porci]|uniref:Phosphatidylglycerol--prolipoprotein diacylglyceryl transferase n=1 Tax=Pseudoramibacter porci TaxID=2606631 RepID=A0A7X2NHJ7_9FIRM|nr:prolipoprotein diacylglyceryl transferase [Pseudoramibacter porci]MSS20639.1 prolipoprotein diacylglyceryl transferase [Pseudoramibacter porci]